MLLCDSNGGFVCNLPVLEITFDGEMFFLLTCLLNPKAF